MPVPKVKRFTPLNPGEEIVISGIAGRFPNSDNAEELKKNLFDKVDLITDDNRRWRLDHPDIPQRTGKISNVSKFDALFFGVHFKQAHTMDPMCRMLLEHAYEAVIDAGINPRQLRGSRTGVFVGTSFSESEKTWFYEKLQVNGFGITGCSRAMMANRISYWLGVHGPSYTVDSACSSSLHAVENAYRSILDGQCDDALVGGANLCLHPYVSLQYSRLGVLSADGRCKCFDNNADGYARSEAVSVIYLQKAKNAKRIYGTLVYGKTNCDGFKEQGITFPSSKMQSVLLRDCYKECGMSPNSVSFLECHATGTRIGDPEELNAIEKVFLQDRSTPLLIGSIKSNIGHTEPASGICQIVKILMTMETGMIPPNIHYTQPRKGVKALEDGRLKVVTESTPWEGGYAAINSFGFGGANCHVILKSHTKSKNSFVKTDDLARLVVVSGRTEESIKVFLDDIVKNSTDIEYIRLLHDIHVDDIQGHLYRGYTIVGSKITDTPVRQIDNYSGAKRPIWFVFSGMGSQWLGMGIDFMRFPVFKQAIEKCDAVLRPRGVDIIKIITNKDKTMFDNILHSFVGIAACQIGLADLLSSIGIVPDNIIGHSVGELGCAYADGSFTAEQMILAAYARGLASIESDLIYGAMAAVGLGNEDIKNMCPPDIEVACHNAADSSTISGPAESLRKFVAQLQANKIFAKEVATSNIAYHSRYIAPAGPKLLAYLNEIIPDPKPRSRKWMSTSVPRSKWFTASAKLSSAEYHTNNLLNAVLFEETARMIPKDAVTIEIAPHGLLQAILKRSLGPDVINIPLAQRGHRDNTEVFLQGIGMLYNIGLQPDIAKLYPPIEYPVSRGTAMISPSIRWEHSDDWYVTSFKTQKKIISGERVVDISLKNEEDEYLINHVIDGKTLIPATAYLDMIWKTIGILQAETHTNLSIVFEDVTFVRATHIPKEGKVQLMTMVQKGTGRFEISEGNAIIATGTIRVTPNPVSEKASSAILPEDNDEEEVMKTEDIYKEMRLRGYHFAGDFCSLKSTSISVEKGHIAWVDNWVTFLDGMLQMMLLEMDTRDLYVPTKIQKIVIDTKLHQQEIQKLTLDDGQLPVRFYKKLGIIKSGGVEIRGFVSTLIPRQLLRDPILEKYKFVAHRDGAQISLQEAIRLSAHIASESHQITRMKTIELIDNSDVTTKELASPILAEVLDDLPLIQANIFLVASNRFDSSELPSTVNCVDLKKISSDAVLAVGIELLTKKKNDQLQAVLSKLRKGGFVLTRERTSKPDNLSALSKYHLDIVLEKCTDKENIILLKKKEAIRKTEIVYINNNELSWIKKLHSIMNAENENTDDMRIILVGEGDYECGLLGFVNCLRKELGSEIIRAVFIQDSKAPKFSLQNSLYSEQLQLDLAINVLRPGKMWGSYRHLPLPRQEPKPVQHAFVTQLVRNDLNSLRWIEGPIRPNIDQQDLVRIVYSSINFKDIMFSTGKLITNSMEISTRFNVGITIGLEYAGIDTAGRRVMGISENRSIANVIVPDRSLCWHVPDNWSLEDAATVPCVYATCYYALYVSGEMKKGNKVLIHSGAGGIGQAAIHLALHEGCEVFTTVGTLEKRKFIREKFPSIQDDHIGNSHDTSFEQMVLQQTQGTGVDIVLNSLTDEKLQASVRCMAKNGRFLEIGKLDLVSNNFLGMMVFLKEISFHGIMLDNLFSNVNEKLQVNNLVAQGLKSGAIKPLVRKVFEREDVTAAFKYMTTGKHIGKIILKICNEKEIGTPIRALPRYYCDSKKSYVILGGLGGIGLELADWLILRGAKNLVLVSRTGVKTGYQHFRIDRWKSYGVNVLIISGVDASSHKDCEFILKSAEKQAPVDAIFNLVIALRDGIFKNQTVRSFEESLKGKAWITKRMDELSRKLCPQLRQFVVFSSMFCGRGNAGQTNYGMANSVMERICEKRVADGLPGLAVQFGTIDEVGIVARMQKSNEELLVGGVQQQRVSSCFKNLEEFLLQDQPVVASMIVAEKQINTSGTVSIVKTVANIIGVNDIKTVSQHISLPELGMDSIIAVEIKQALERDFDVFLSTRDIRNLTFAKLAEMEVTVDTGDKAKEQGKGQNAEAFGIQMLLHITRDENIIPEICMELLTRNDRRKMDAFFLPGIEGFGQTCDSIASKIKPRTICLQYGLNKLNDLTSIPEYANYLLPYVLPTVEEKRMFVLVGYSFGSVIAIELAKQLEDRGFNGRLILIDGAPQLMKAMIEQYLPSSTQNELQNNVLLSIVDALQLSASEELRLDLDKHTTWEKKLDSFISHIPPDSVPLSAKNLKMLCTSVYKHIVAFNNYDLSSLPQLRTPVTLLKPTVPAIQLDEETYGLHEITKTKIKVFYVEGNHVTIMNSDKVVTAINGDPLEDHREFKKLILTDKPLDECEPESAFT